MGPSILVKKKTLGGHHHDLHMYRIQTFLKIAAVYLRHLTEWRKSCTRSGHQKNIYAIKDENIINRDYE